MDNRQVAIIVLEELERVIQIDYNFEETYLIAIETALKKAKRLENDSTDDKTDEFN